MAFYFNSGTVFFKKLYIKAFTVVIDYLKVFFFTMSRLRHKFPEAFIYVVLKMVSSLMADWNVSNPEFFMLFHTNPHIFCAKI